MKMLTREGLLETIQSQLQEGFEYDLLKKEFTQLMPQLYGYIETIMETVTKPVAFTLLALFFLLELQRLALKIESSGSSMAGAEMVFKLLFKVMLFKIIIENVGDIMSTMYEASRYLITKIEMQASMSGSLDLNARYGLGNIDTSGNNLLAWIGMGLTTLVVMAVNIFVKVVVNFRVIEIYFYTAVSPIPLATLPNEELGQIGKGFLKTYAGVCIHGVMLCLIFTFMPFITELLPAGASEHQRMFALTAFSCLFGYCVVGSSRWAKVITGAVA